MAKCLVHSIPQTQTPQASNALPCIRCPPTTTTTQPPTLNQATYQPNWIQSTVSTQHHNPLRHMLAAVSQPCDVLAISRHPLILTAAGPVPSWVNRPTGCISSTSNGSFRSCNLVYETLQILLTQLCLNYRLPRPSRSVRCMALCGDSIKCWQRGMCTGKLLQQLLLIQMPVLQQLGH